VIQGASPKDGGAYDGLAVLGVVVDVVDDDAAQVLILPAGGSTLVAEHPEATPRCAGHYQVVLTKAPTGAWKFLSRRRRTARITDNSGSVITQLRFTTGNWSAPQIVKVTAIDDTAREGVHFSRITHRISDATRDAFLGVTLPNVADGLADKINANIDSEVSASASGATLTIEGPAFESELLAPFASATITLSGTPLAGENWIVIINGVAKAYTVQDGDELSDVAAGLASLLDAVNGIAASASEAVVTIADTSTILFSLDFAATGGSDGSAAIAGTRASVTVESGSQRAWDLAKINLGGDVAPGAVWSLRLDGRNTATPRRRATPISKTSPPASRGRCAPAATTRSSTARRPSPCPAPGSGETWTVGGRHPYAVSAPARRSSRWRAPWRVAHGSRLHRHGDRRGARDFRTAPFILAFSSGRCARQGSEIDITQVELDRRLPQYRRALHGRAARAVNASATTSKQWARSPPTAPAATMSRRIGRARRHAGRHDGKSIVLGTTWTLAVGADIGVQNPRVFERADYRYSAGSNREILRPDSVDVRILDNDAPGILVTQTGSGTQLIEPSEIVLVGGGFLSQTGTGTTPAILELTGTVALGGVGSRSTTCYSVTIVGGTSERQRSATGRGCQRAPGRGGRRACGAGNGRRDGVRDDATTAISTIKLTATAPVRSLSS
jgi:hypothetical protein